MTNVILKGLPAGNAELHYASKVEPYRQGLTPRPAPLITKTVGDVGEAGPSQVTFDLIERIEYVVFAADGKGRNVMLSTTRGGSP